MKKYALSISSILLIIIIWQLGANRVDNPYILPGFISVISKVIDLLLSLETYLIIMASLLRLLTSIFMAISLGILLGLLAGIWLNIDIFLKPILSTIKTLPVASIIVIILILFTKSTALYVITFLILFPIIYEATRQGVLNIDKELVDSLRLEPVRYGSIIKSFYLPLALPYIKTSFLQSFGLGFKVLIMAEFISQAEKSIGQSLYISSISINYELVFAWSIIIILIAYLIDSIIATLKTH
ncbi:MAG: ABC transporter permease [Candidatus Izemoplasmataceae bacterium]